MLKKENLKGIIICGGQSNRMGTDKSQMDWKGIPFYMHVRNALSEYCDDIYISCNKSQKDNYKLPVIVDQYEDIGPLAGILSVMKTLGQESFITIPCDMPMINKDIIDRMVKSNKDNSDGVFIKDMNSNIEPMLAIYNHSMYGIFLKAYQSGIYSLKKIIESCNNVDIIHLENEPLINLNSPDEVDKFKEENL